MRGRILTAVATLTVLLVAEPAAATRFSQRQPQEIGMLAGSHSWLVYGVYDVNPPSLTAVDVRAVDRGGRRVSSLPVAFADSRRRVWVVHGVLSSATESPGEVLWADLRTGESGATQLPQDTGYVGGSADGWLAVGPQGLVDISRSGDVRVIDPAPPRDGRYLVSGRGFSLTVDDAVTYRSWRHLSVAHVFRPDHRDGERLFCFDLSATAMDCSMDKEFCPRDGCDDEPRTRHRPYFIPLTHGRPVRSPFVGYLLGRSVTITAFDGTTLRNGFRTWHATSRTVSSALTPTTKPQEVTGRALGHLILQRENFTSRGLVGQLIAATPDMSEYRVVACLRTRACQ